MTGYSVLAAMAARITRVCSISLVGWRVAGILATTVMGMGVTYAESPTNPPGSYYTSWLGNSFMDYGTRHKGVPEELEDMKAAPNGTVLSAGYNENFGGAATYNANGSFAGRYDGYGSGFGSPVKSVEVDDNYVYLGLPNGKGIHRFNHGGSSSSNAQWLKGDDITGLYIRNNKLWVSDWTNRRVRILNLSDGSEVTSWPVTNPMHLAVDGNERCWVVQWDPASTQTAIDGPVHWGKNILSFSNTGVQGPSITDFEKPLAVAIDNNNQLLVGGWNQHSQIWIYNNLGGSPARNGTFGELNGLFSGTAGAFTTSPKLHWIKAIDVDLSGNIYTASIYGTFWGHCVEKWTASGTLLWRVFAGTSLDCAGIDPNNETEVYSKYHHYTLDYSKTTPGTEWSLKAFTVNRYKYPTDYRVDFSKDVGERSLGAGAFRIGGKLFMARSSQAGYRWELYRQETTTDGEVLVPSVNMGAGTEPADQFYNSSTKAWHSYPKYKSYNQYWSLAKNGDLLTLAGNNYHDVVRFPYGGLDSNNNPIWRAANAVVYTLSDHPSVWVRRIVYDSDNDVLYAVGNENTANNCSTKLVRYDHFTTARTKTWTVSLPFMDSNYVPDVNYGGGTAITLAQAGKYLFLGYGYGHIRILNQSTGALVGTLVQAVNGWHGGGGQVDAAYGLTAFQRSTGEYVLLFENAGWGNIMMTRWNDGSTPSVAAPTFSRRPAPTTASSR